MTPYFSCSEYEEAVAYLLGPDRKAIVEELEVLEKEQQCSLAQYVSLERQETSSMWREQTHAQPEEQQNQTGTHHDDTATQPYSGVQSHFLRCFGLIKRPQVQETDRLHLEPKCIESQKRHEFDTHSPAGPRLRAQALSFPPVQTSCLQTESPGLRAEFTPEQNADYEPVDHLYQQWKQPYQPTQAILGQYSGLVQKCQHSLGHNFLFGQTTQHARGQHSGLGQAAQPEVGFYSGLDQTTQRALGQYQSFRQKAQHSQKRGSGFGQEQNAPAGTALLRPSKQRHNSGNGPRCPPNSPEQRISSDQVQCPLQQYKRKYSSDFCHPCSEEVGQQEAKSDSGQQRQSPPVSNQQEALKAVSQYPQYPPVFSQQEAPSASSQYPQCLRVFSQQEAPNVSSLQDAPGASNQYPQYSLVSSQQEAPNAGSQYCLYHQYSLVSSRQDAPGASSQYPQYSHVSSQQKLMLPPPHSSRKEKATHGKIGKISILSVT